MVDVGGLERGLARQIAQGDLFDCGFGLERQRETPLKNPVVVEANSNLDICAPKRMSREELVDTGGGIAGAVDLAANPRLPAAVLYLQADAAWLERHHEPPAILAGQPLRHSRRKEPDEFADPPSAKADQQAR